MIAVRFLLGVARFVYRFVVGDDWMVAVVMTGVSLRRRRAAAGS